MTVTNEIRTAASRPRIALLESRMSRELARLVDKHGGEPVCVPAVREQPASVAPRRHVHARHVAGDRLCTTSRCS